MRDIEEIYSYEKGGYVSPYPDYITLIESTGTTVVLSEEVGSYQGDYYLLLTEASTPENPARIGFLVFGYGSCSGCDALEAASSSIKDLDDLRRDLYNDIEWRTSPAELAKRLKEKDWDGTFIDAEGKKVIRVFYDRLMDPLWAGSMGIFHT